jgi:polysaccharide chain length determinant protein (PEP-CTERM system associated)
MDTGLETLWAQAKLVIRSVWNRRWMVIAVSSVMALLLCAAVTFIPNRYQAASRVYVDTQTVLKPLMAGLTYQPDIDQQVRMLAKTLIARPNVERILEKDDFGFDIADPLKRERLINDLMDKIKVEAAGAGNLYTVMYRDINKERARRVVEAIVDLFMHSSEGDKRRDSNDASRFINDQIKEYESKLMEAENRVKEFKVRNLGITGTQGQDYFARMAEISDQVNKLRIDLAAAEQTRDSYRRELLSEEPQLPESERMPTIVLPQAPSEIETRLEAQKKQLDELLRRFTDKHPDVIAARRLIAQLEADKRKELQESAGSRGESAAKRTARAAATSPIYQRIRMAAADAEAQAASLRTQLRAQQARLTEIKAIASRVPQVESELAQLNRDYDVVRKNYEALVARRESASLGVKLDESSQLASFRVVEPPRVLPNPVFPAKRHLAVVAILGSLLSGIALAIALELLRPTFLETHSLRQLSGRPVLGTISPSFIGNVKQRARAEAMKFGSAVFLLLALQAGWLVWLALANRPVVVQ